MYQIRSLFTFLLLCCLSLLSFSQPSNYQGAPHIQNFDPNNNTGSKQTYAICQDSRGILFFGGAEGILEYDGNTWRKHLVPNKSIVTSLATDSTGIIYVGANNDFGYLKPGSVGSLIYHSLNHLVPSNTPYYQSVWNVFITPQGVYYICQNKIFRFIDGTIEVITANLVAPSAYQANGTIYVQDKTIGMATIDGNQLKPLPHFTVDNLEKKGFFFINALSAEELMITFSRTEHIYKFNTTTKELTVIDLPKQTALFLQENLISHILNLQNGTIAISTSQGGIVILNKNLEIVKIINEERGLVSNSVNVLFADKVKNLWAIHTKGVSRIDMSYPITFFCKRQGINAPVTTSTVHNGIQYIGTEDKCLYLPPYQLSMVNDNHKAIEIKKLYNCHQFLHVKGHLLLCNWIYLSEINKNTAQHIYNDGEKIYCAAYDTRYSDKIAIGQNKRIIICTIKDSGNGSFLELKNTFTIEGKLSQIRSMVFDHQGNLWLASYNEGISCIIFKNNNLNDYSILHFSADHGLPRDIEGACVKKFIEVIV